MIESYSKTRSRLSNHYQFQYEYSDDFDSRYNIINWCVTFYNVEFKNTIIESANNNI